MNAWTNERPRGTHGMPITVPVTGRVTSVDRAGVWVAVGDQEPVRARLLAGVDQDLLFEGREVLLVFEGGDPSRPIIMGALESVLDDLIGLEMNPSADVPAPKEARVDGKRVVFEADEEIELKCGKSSITLKKNGKIVIKGTELLSRASGTNRIKGGSVGIN